MCQTIPKLKEEAGKKAKEAPDKMLAPLLGEGLQEKVTDQSDSTKQPPERKASYEDTVALITTIENNIPKGSPLKPDEASYVDTAALISNIEKSVEKGSPRKSDDPWISFDSGNKSKSLSEVEELEQKRKPLDEVIWHWISVRVCCKRNRQDRLAV